MYYILTKSGRKNPLPEINTHSAHYPNNIALSMKLEEIPEVGSTFVEKAITFDNDKFTIEINKELARFYYEYPICGMEVYFNAPISDKMMKSLVPFLNSRLSGKTEVEKVAKLLQFSQNAFSYKTDEEQFGREKYFFPDEVFYYPYSDCEDRSILFTHLVSHFTNYHSIGLDFPGHVNTAVAFDNKMDGTYIEVDGKKYTVCDPVYENAPIGYLDARYKKFQPGIITFDNSLQK